MGKSTFILTEDLHVQDPHDVFLSLFNPSNDDILLGGSMKDFLKRSFIIIIAVVGLRSLFENYLPGIIDVVTAVIIAVASVFFVTYFVKAIIPFFLSVKGGAMLAVGVVILIGVVVGLG